MSWKPKDALFQVNLNDPISILANLVPYTESADSKGHGSIVGTRVPAFINRAIEEIRQNPDTPYKTASDVLRDLIFVGLAILSIRYKTQHQWALDASLAQVRALMSREAQRIVHIQETIKTIKQLQEFQGDEVAKEHLQGYYSTLMESPEPDRSRLLAAFSDAVRDTKLLRLLGIEYTEVSG